MRLDGAIACGLFFAVVMWMPGIAGKRAVDRQAAGAGAVDVCALLPRDEVSKILGRNIGRARPQTRSDGPAECRYSGGLRGTITVMVGTGTTRPKWDAFIKELKDSGAPLEPVAGVGDGAYFRDDNRFYALAGSHQVTVSTSPTPGTKGAKRRADALALAKVVIGKLKR